MNEQILKPGWKGWRFEQIVANLVERVNPGDTSLDHYVGLEHLDSESLKIKRWGTPGDVIGEKLHFCIGDVIFGKRRAYQRKLAVADFEGICSAHAMVLRAKPEVVLPEFLPFFMQSDLFMNRALEISVGSLSPTINWRTLAEQEFLLPPFEEQHRIANLLWAINDSSYVILDLIKKAEDLKMAFMNQLLARGSIENNEFQNSELGEIPKDWEVCAIEEKLEIIIDYRGKTPQKTSSGTPLITARNIREGYIDPEPREYIAEDTYDERMTRGIPKVGDIFFTTEAPLGMVAKVPEYKFSPGQRMIILRGKINELNSNFLYWLLLWNESQQRILQKSHGSTVVGIKQSVFRKLLFRFPPIMEQIEISQDLDAIQQGLDRSRNHLSMLKMLRKSAFEALRG
jgi:type I restriction enzyme, S subunit